MSQELAPKSLQENPLDGYRTVEYARNPFEIDGEVPDHLRDSGIRNQVNNAYFPTDDIEKPKSVRPDKIPVIPARVVREIVDAAKTDEDPRVRAHYVGLEELSKLYNELDRMSRPRSLKLWSKLVHRATNYLHVLGVSSLAPQSIHTSHRSARPEELDVHYYQDGSKDDDRRSFASSDAYPPRLRKIAMERLAGDLISNICGYYQVFGKTTNQSDILRKVYKALPENHRRVQDYESPQPLLLEGNHVDVGQERALNPVEEPEQRLLRIESELLQIYLFTPPTQD